MSDYEDRLPRLVEAAALEDRCPVTFNGKQCLLDRGHLEAHEIVIEDQSYFVSQSSQPEESDG